MGGPGGGVEVVGEVVCAAAVGKCGVEFGFVERAHRFRQEGDGGEREGGAAAPAFAARSAARVLGVTAGSGAYFV